MGFQIQIWLPVMKQDIILFMSTVEDTRTKIMFIMHKQLNRKIHYLSIVLWNIRYYYENLAIYYYHYDNSFFNMLSQQQDINMQIRYSL